MTEKKAQDIKLFISYSWDNKNHCKWVRKLVNNLKDFGFQVLFDQDLEIGSPLTLFMNESIKQADKVLVIGTPTYLSKYNKKEGGVAFEDSIIEAHLLSEIASTKFCPILRKGSFEDSFPPIISTRKGMDFRNDRLYEQNLNNLILSLSPKQCNDAYFSQYEYIKAKSNRIFNQIKGIRESEDLTSHINKLRETIRLFGRKPYIGLYGDYDAGKSTLANELINKKLLPTGLAPTTQVPTILIHEDDRPSGLADNVYLFNQKWNPLFYREKEYYTEQFIVRSGEYKLLKSKIVYSNEQSFISYAVVFVNSDILKFCNIIDFPGYNNIDEDYLKKTCFTFPTDITFFLSPINGFMGINALSSFGYLLENIPNYEENILFDKINFVYIIASHCDPTKYKRTEIDNTKKKAAKRISLFFGDRKVFEKKKLSYLRIKKRIFEYWNYRVESTLPFTEDLNDLIKNVLPPIFKKRFDKRLNVLYKEIECSYKQQLANLQTQMTELANLKTNYSDLIKDEERRKIQQEKINTNITKRIKEKKAKTKEIMDIYYDKLVEKSSILSIIENRFSSDKKEAKDFLAGYLIEKLQDKLKDCFRVESQDICAELCEVRNNFEALIEQNHLSSFIRFDTLKYFAAGIVSLTSLGAWTFCNDLYTIPTLMATGFLSGGGIAVIVAILVKVAVLIVINVLSDIFHPNVWKEKLAQNIIEKFKENKVKSKIYDIVNNFWDTSEVVYRTGIQATNEKWQQMLELKSKEIDTGNITIKTIRRHQKKIKSEAEFILSVCRTTNDCVKLNDI